MKRLSGHMDPGQLVHRLTYQMPVVSRSETGDMVRTWSDVYTLRAAIVESHGKQEVIVMKDTEVQEVRYIHRYRAGLQQDMRVVDDQGVVYQLISWIDKMHRRWVEVLVRRVDQR